MLARLSDKTRKLFGVVIIAVVLAGVALVVHAVTGADAFFQVSKLLVFVAAGFTGVTIVNIVRDLRRP